MPALTAFKCQANYKMRSWRVKLHLGVSWLVNGWNQLKCKLTGSLKLKSCLDSQLYMTQLLIAPIWVLQLSVCSIQTEWTFISKSSQNLTLFFFIVNSSVVAISTAISQSSKIFHSIGFLQPKGIVHKYYLTIMYCQSIVWLKNQICSHFAYSYVTFRLFIQMQHSLGWNINDPVKQDILNNITIDIESNERLQILTLIALREASHMPYFLIYFSFASLVQWVSHNCPFSSSSLWVDFFTVRKMTQPGRKLASNPESKMNLFRKTDILWGKHEGGMQRHRKSLIARGKIDR